MKSCILIIGGNGLVGKKMERIFKERNPKAAIFIGGRNPKNTEHQLFIDVTKPETLDNLLSYKIDLIVLAVNDKLNNVLDFAIRHKIDYLDITKPTPDLIEAYTYTKLQNVNSTLFFGSGWMGGIIASLIQTNTTLDQISKVDVFVYYSVHDEAGESSAHFMAENVAKPFVMYKNNKAVEVKHFLDSENFFFSYGIGKRQTYNFDVPDLYILNNIEKIANVRVKTTYSSKTVTWLLKTFQQLGLFNILSLEKRRKIFSVNGKGDQTVFEVVFKKGSISNKVSLKSERGQGELTALATVLHAEEMLKDHLQAGVYFSHQLHQPQNIVNSLKQHKGILIDYLV